ncbi:MAG TPA: MsnO8 family LLM class oxidoreductase [Thermoanaerobaculia bacterium]|nr:MsnO8 family LLM class oxidoreductase [Thermoanaerobaculia bacterium]
MSQPFRLGALDFCHLHDGTWPVQVLCETLDLAPRVESFGYSRYWLAEHHNPNIAHGSPEVLLPLLAASTSSMRVGTAGILLNYYSPYKVASVFRALSALFPQRIDLGLARGSSGEPIRRVMLGDAPQSPYAEKVGDLMSFLRGKSEPVAHPAGTPPPEVWVLGSQTTSLEIAAAHGTAFCLALFLHETEVDVRALLDEYKARFQPSPELASPKWAVAVAGACAEREEEAQQHARNRLPFVTPTLVGTPEQCRESLEEMRRLYETDEIVFLDLCRAFDDRVRSYGLLAEAAGLPAPVTPAAS